METYKILNRELTLKNQELNIIAGQLRRDVNILNSQLLREKEKQQEMVQSIVKILTQSYNEIIKLFYPGVDQQSRCLQEDKGVSTPKNFKDKQEVSSRSEQSLHPTEYNGINNNSNNKRNSSSQQEKTGDNLHCSNDESPQPQLSSIRDINTKNITVRSRRPVKTNCMEEESIELTPIEITNKNVHIPSNEGTLISQENTEKSISTYEKNYGNETEKEGESLSYSSDYGNYNSRIMSIIPEETSSVLQESTLINHKNGNSLSDEYSSTDRGKILHTNDNENLRNKMPPPRRSTHIVLRNSTGKCVNNFEESASFNLTSSHPTSTPYSRNRPSGRILDRTGKSSTSSERNISSAQSYDENLKSNDVMYEKEESSVEESEYKNVKPVRVCLQRLKPNIIAKFSLESNSSSSVLSDSVVETNVKLTEPQQSLTSSSKPLIKPTSASPLSLNDTKNIKTEESNENSQTYRNARPKRKAAPISLVEPNLHLKLRRNK